MNKLTFKAIFLLLFFYSFTAYSSGWYPVPTQTINTNFIDIAAINESYNGELFVLGSDQRIYFTKDGGHSWEVLPSPQTGQANALTVHQNWSDTTLVVVGNSGLLHRSTNAGRDWLVEDFATQANLNSAVNFNFGSDFYVTGDSSLVYHSTDRGVSWLPEGVATANVSMIKVVYHPEFGHTFGIGVRNDSTFIFYRQSGFFMAEDTLPGIIANDAAIYDGFTQENMYIGGYDASSGDAILVEMPVLAGFAEALYLGSPNYINPPSSRITSILIFYDESWNYKDKIALTSDSGEILQQNIEDGAGGQWLQMYKDPQNTRLNTSIWPQVSEGSVPPYVAGDNGLLLNYDFVLVGTIPPRNGSGAFLSNRLELQFSSPPDLTSLQSNTFINSNFRGIVPFTASYDAADSNIVYLDPPQTQTPIPGEEYSLSFRYGVWSRQNFNTLKTQSIDMDFLGDFSNNFNFTQQDPQETAEGRSTNIVAGLFNEDEFMDFVAVCNGIQGQIYSFGSAGSTGIQYRFTDFPEYAPNFFMDFNIDQTKTLDINADGKLDMLAFDESEIWGYQNFSTGTNIDFSLSRKYRSINIKDVEVFNHDYDNLTDVVILNDSLQVRTDITSGWGQFGGRRYYELGVSYSDIAVGDIFGDGNYDIVAADFLGNLVIYFDVDGRGFFNPIVVPNGFKYIKMADLDNDGDLDLITHDGGVNLNIIETLPGYNFNPIINPLPMLGEFRGFDIFDFDGDSYKDILRVNESNQLQKFKNTSGSSGMLTFSEEMAQPDFTNLNAYGLTHLDLDADGFVDLLAFDHFTGDIEIFRKEGLPQPPQYTPVIDSISFQQKHVYLSWNQYPDTSFFDYYVVYRDTLPNPTKPIATISSITDSSFRDSTIVPGQFYNYAVQAFFNDSDSSGYSSSWFIQTINELSGSVAGVLSPTAFPYEVTGNIFIEPDSSLTILSDVELMFHPATRFDVFGSLDAQGTDTTLMVNFFAHDTLNPWAGVRIHPGADTVKFKWVTVDYADTAVWVDSRPVKLVFGELANCDNGLVLANSSFMDLNHYFVRHNKSGIITLDNSVLKLNFATVFKNNYNGISSFDNSLIDIRNSIIWDNNINFPVREAKFEDIFGNSTLPIELAYSTVDSITGNINTDNIYRFAPVFMPPDSGHFRIDLSSPTIDLGDPLEDFSKEPLPNGSRVNLGTYGGSEYATITQQPRIGVKNDTLDFAAVAGQTDSLEFKLYNKGTVLMNVSNVIIFGDYFTNDAPVPAVIPPGDSLAFNILFDPSDMVSDTSIMQILTDDPHYPAPGYEIVLQGHYVNSAPFFTGGALSDTTEAGLFYSETINLEDVDNDAINFEITQLPAWLDFTENLGENTFFSGNLYGTPAISDTGMNYIELAFNDDKDTTKLIHNLYVKWVNKKPTFISTALKNGTEDLFYSDTVYAADPDTMPMVYSLGSAPAWLSISSQDSMAVISGTPLQLFVGLNTVQVIVTDNGGLKDTLDAQFTITNVNDKPLAQNSKILPAGATEFDTLKIDYTFFDEDGDTQQGFQSYWYRDGVLQAAFNNSPEIPPYKLLGDQEWWGKILVNDGQVWSDTAYTDSITIIQSNTDPFWSGSSQFNINEDSPAVQFDLYNFVQDLEEPDDSLSINISNGDPVHLSAVLSGGRFLNLQSLVPDYFTISPISVEVEVQDTKGGSLFNTISVHINNVNDGPTITSVPVTLATEDVPYQYQVTATDPDFAAGDTLEYSFLNAPLFLNINASSGLISGTPTNDDVGFHTIELQIKDTGDSTDTQQYTLQVENVNDPPVISSQADTTADEGSQYIYQVVASDPDTNEVLVYSLENSPGWLTINSSTGEISGIPHNANVGDTVVTVKVDDGHARKIEVTQQYNLHVANVNDPPEITSSPGITVNEDALYQYQVTANDSDLVHGDVLTYQLLTAPGFLNINTNNGLISGTPQNADVGIHSISVQVKDNSDSTDTQNWQLTVQNVNDPPQITSSADTTANEDEEYLYQLTATDPDVGDNLLYSFDTAPSWLTIDAATGLIKGTPFNAQVGDTVVTVRVDDGNARKKAAVTQTYNLHILNNNDNPEITSSPVVSTNEDALYQYQVTANDSDLVFGDSLSFELLENPAFLSIDPVSGLLSGTPLNSDVGIHTVEVLVKDRLDSSDVQNFQLEVLNTNDSPQITSTPVISTLEDELYQYQVIADDPDVGDVLLFEFLNAPAFLGIDSNSGLVSGTPANDDVGEHTVSVLVSDLADSADTQEFMLTVINVNDPPEIVTTPDTTINTYFNFNYKVLASDVDSDSLVYSDNSDLFDINAETGRINFKPTAGDTGTYSIIINVTDTELTVADTFQLEIEPTPMLAPENLTVTAGDQKFRLSWINPFNTLYSGTQVYISPDAAIAFPDSQYLVFDSTFANISGQTLNVSRVFGGLEIAESYFISVFNYFQSGSDKLYSPPLPGNGTTLAPQTQFSFVARNVNVPPGRTLNEQVQVKNSGGGTLKFRFVYADSDSVLASWFHIDSTEFSVAPGDSQLVSARFTPNETQPDTIHRAVVTMSNNQPGFGLKSFQFNMRILFDYLAPTVTISLQPDSLLRHAAARFTPVARDTLRLNDWLIGDTVDKLRMRYSLKNAVTNAVFAAADSVAVSSLDFYPLPDASYQFELWVFDTRGNGYAAADRAFSKTFTVNSGTNTIRANKWYLASFPRPANFNMRTVFPDSSSQVYRWSQPENKYVSFADSVLAPGKSAWILQLAPKTINVQSQPIANLSQTHSVDLVQGWNQVGSPVAYPTFFKNMKFRAAGAITTISIQQAINQNLISEAVYRYRSDVLQGYSVAVIDSSVTIPWTGYWMYAQQAGKLFFDNMPALETVVLPKDTSALAKEADLQNWNFSLSVENDKFIDEGNIIGSRAEVSALPALEPPMLSEYCSAYFRKDNKKLTFDFQAPFQTFEEVKDWTLFVESSETGKTHTIRWPSQLNEINLFGYLVDPVNEQIINMNEVNEYSYEHGKKSAQFTVYITQDPSFEPKVIPLTFLLSQNYPNPFNPSTTIKFGIPANGDGNKFTLKIYNVLGQEIKTVFNQRFAPGIYEYRWSGVNNDGNRVASGIYFYRLSGKKVNLTKKMILIR